ncbi:hypothetical protein [Tardiphaga sp. 768_D3_N2_1]|uniref:hypothetical protein n=1 Tax=Tardiphaga sp. 768_D3_N2_1 TaxID=3240783 RepID=UPI003F8931B7
MSRLGNKLDARILREILLVVMSFWAAPPLIFVKATLRIYSIANEFGCAARAPKAGLLLTRY